MIEIDKINGILFESYALGNSIKTLNSTPCSICRKWIEDNPTRDTLVRIELPEIHFHGSEFNSCERKVFLNYLNGGTMSFSDAPFLNDGHLHESSILQSIYAGLPDGWKIKIFENQGEQIRDILGFKLVSHMDSVIMTPDRAVYGLECKAVKDKNFSKYKDGIIDPIWYGQIQSYMFSNNIDCFYLIVKNRDTSKIHIPIKIEKDLAFIATRLNVLKDVAQAIHLSKNNNRDRQPNRKHDTSKNVECEFCPFKYACWKE